MPSADPASPGDAVEADPLDEAVVDVVTRGELSVTGRLTDASNVTLLGDATLDGLTVPCIYKPIRGERPLWDFPDGTLAERELAAYLVSTSAGWHCVPLTVMRDGPFGPGMVQQWIEDADPEQVVDLVPVDQIPAGWLPVLRAVDTDGAPIAVVHADTPALARLAGFDLVVNNADRKGSHILPTSNGGVLGVDHGLCFHREDKLRTILWGWAGQPLPEVVLDGLARLRSGLDGELGERLGTLITASEVHALHTRMKALTEAKVFPRAPVHRTPIPWPPL